MQLFGPLKQDSEFYKSVRKIALPVALQSVLVNSLALIDTFMIGFLGEKQLAAATLATQPFFVITVTLFGLQSGGAVLISQYWGKRDLNAINRVMGISLRFCLVFSILIASVLFLWPDLLLRFMSPEADVIAYGAEYTKYVAFSYVFNAVTVVYFGVQRSIENVNVGVLVQSSAVVMNIFFNYIFMFGIPGLLPAMGVAGVALGTLVARIIEFCFMLIYALFFNKRMKLDFGALLRPGRALVGDYIKYAWPVVLNEALWSTGFSMFNVMYGRMGSQFVAANTIASNFERFASVLIIGVGNAATILVGKQIGAGGREKAYSYGGTLGVLGLLAGLAMGLIALVAAPLTFGFFEFEPSALQLAQVFLLFCCAGLPAKGYNRATLVGTLRAGGDVKFIMFIDVFFLWTMAVPLAWLCSQVWHLPFYFVAVIVLAEESVKAVICFKRYKSRVWIRDVTRVIAREGG